MCRFCTVVGMLLNEQGVRSSWRALYVNARRTTYQTTQKRCNIVLLIRRSLVRAQVGEPNNQELRAI